MKAMADELSTNTTCNAGCPVQATAQIVEHKWATLIIRDLLSGKKRFSELEQSLGSISPKILSERLRELEAKQLITRSVYPTVPPTTDYELTALGKELEAVIRAMQDFGNLLLQTNPIANSIQNEQP
jgi:DNA-binding HxlR family transcriptional regulator